MAATKRPGRLKVGVIGAGKVGVIIAKALSLVDHEIIGVTASTRAENTDRVVALLNDVPTVDPETICAKADLVLVTVPDDQIQPVVSGLAKLNAWRPGQIVAHFSGVHGLTCLADAAMQGALTLALHPAMTFTGSSLDLNRLQECPAAVTASPITQPIGLALLGEIGCLPQVVDEENRKLYHAAQAHGANHLNTLVTQAAQALGEAGIENPAQFLRPLLETALERALTEGIHGLTGAVGRADTGTIKSHLEALSAPSVKKIKPAYRALSHATAEFAHQIGRINDQQLTALKATLESGESQLN